MPELAPGTQTIPSDYAGGQTVDHLSHVVKFSGGRSSAAMVLLMAREGLLAPERNDVVLFANTTAEHPETYEFAAQVCDELETEHGVPCLWYEFCTVESPSRNGWTRIPSYRLVTRQPVKRSDDPFSPTPGYRADGTAFEELVSLKAMIPNRKMRFCTQWLKVRPGIALLADWFGGGPGPEFAGHHFDKSLVNADDAAERYKGKAMTKAQHKAIQEFAYSRPWARPQQHWADFTVVAPRPNSTARPLADIAGRAGPPHRYLTLLGLRADEPKRVQRAQFEAMMAEGATSSACRHDSHPAGEMVAAPLHEAGWGKADVEAFWREQPYDLSIGSAAGNCVYCFMKGETALRELAIAEPRRRWWSKKPTPESIHWWSDIEQRYAGQSTEDDTGRFNFLAIRARTYQTIADNSADTPPPPQNFFQRTADTNSAVRLHRLDVSPLCPARLRKTNQPLHARFHEHPCQSRGQRLHGHPRTATELPRCG